MLLSRAADPRMVWVTQLLTRLACMLVVGLAALAVVGRFTGIAFLTSLRTGGVAMNVWTALGMVVAAVALWLLSDEPVAGRGRRTQVAQALAVGVALLGLQRLIAYALDLSWAIDEGLTLQTRGSRMAPNTAWCFLFSGASLALLDVDMGPRRFRPAAWLALLPGAVGLLAIAGYVYGVLNLYAVSNYIEMALNSAVCFVILAVGTLCARPDREPVATLLSQTAGGATARRLLPAAILAPLFLGWLLRKGEQRQWYGTEVGIALFSVVLLGLFVTMVYLSGRSLAKAELGRRATEEMLAASEAFYHTLVETLPQNIFRKDLQGRFTFANGRFLSEIGRTVDQVVGKTDYDFFPQALADRYRKDDQAVIRTGTPFETVEEHVTPTGEKLYVQVIKTAVTDDRGKVIGSQGMFWDVTEKKRYEEMLEQKNQQLEEAAHAEREAREALLQAQGQLVQSEKLAGLGQMVAGVAHEINNPLAFVGNNVAVMQRDMAAIRRLLDLYKQADGALPDNLRKEIADLEEQMDLAYTLSNLDGLFARSRDGLRRIQQIVKDLRDFARLDESDLGEVDLNAGIDSTLNIIQGHAKRKHVKIIPELGDIPRVTCYPAKVNQVVMNLVGNAIDASHDNGEVVVRTKADGQYVTIEVQDNGSGIPPHIRQKIFDPFFTTKPQGEGTGLGLSISYGIVRDHGGVISVDSEEGKGSCFRVKLPVKAEKVAT